MAKPPAAPCVPFFPGVAERFIIPGTIDDGARLRLSSREMIVKGLRFLLLLGLACTTGASATAQMPDIIVIDDQTLALNTNPLTGYLNGRTDFIPKEAEMSSANWRRHVASWRISEDQLFLTSVDVRLYDEKAGRSSARNVIDALFPGQSVVLADWYSGALIVPDGERTHYVHMGYGSTYSHYRIFRIRQGKVVESLSLDEKQFLAYRETRFSEFKDTDDYRRMLADLKKDVDGMPETQLEDFLKSLLADEYLAR